MKLYLFVFLSYSEHVEMVCDCCYKVQKSRAVISMFMTSVKQWPSLKL